MNRDVKIPIPVPNCSWIVGLGRLRNSNCYYVNCGNAVEISREVEYNSAEFSRSARLNGNDAGGNRRFTASEKFVR